ncbi:MAG: SO_0444 family Cu/Zn efflux transporter, partial [Nitrospinae bacterium]|nr:SO_0444 family Cu/Zn efflux transporter [Nitrospinota bacterium]
MDDLTGVKPLILEESWHLLVDAAPFLLFGFLLAGVIKSFVPLDAVRRHLGGGGFGPTVKAALIGVPLPLCSCSVIPTALALKRQGAHKSAVASFLVSTPETGVDSIAVSYALLDPIMTLFRPVAAFVAALAAGGLELLFGEEEKEPFNPFPVAQKMTCDDGCCGCESPTRATPSERIIDGVRYAFVDLVDDLAGWMLAGLLLAGVMMVMLPDGLFDRPGSDWVVMPLMLVAGVPLYVCATSSTPLAAALILKGVSPGA